MLRRTFLGLFTALASLFLPRSSPSRGLTTAEKEAIVARELQTPAGRLLLAKAMAGPLRCGGLDYAS